MTSGEEVLDGLRREFAEKRRVLAAITELLAEIQAEQEEREKVDR